MPARTASAPSTSPVCLSRRASWVQPAPTPDGNAHAPLDLKAARRVGLDVLVDRARGGSVSAAAQIFKQTSDQLRADRCSNHVAVEDVITSLKTQYHLWVLGLKGSFTRRLLLEYDLDPGQLEGLIDDAIDSITRELNTRFEAESEAEDNQNHG